MIQTVIFDIGNVLMRFGWEPWATARYGEERTRRLEQVFWGTGYCDELDRGAWKVVHFMAKCIEYAPECEADIRDFMAHVGECLSGCSYAIPWVEELKGEGLRVLYLSNYSYFLRRLRPDVLDFIPHMDGGIFSCDVGMIKPDAGIFARICGEYDLAPGECLFIDDSPKNLEAARAYGMHTMHFDGYESCHAAVKRLLDRSRGGRPLIGITPLWDEERDSLWMLPGYTEGIREAGGLPVILPLTEDPEEITQLARMCDGFLLSGGQDVDPAVYGQPRRVDNILSCPARDRMEEALLDRILKLDKPVLGICRGMQLINGALCGDLWQDLPAERGSLPGEAPGSPGEAVNTPAAGEALCHRMAPPYHRPVHTVRILKGTPLHDLLGVEEMGVNSRHHQGVKELSRFLREMAVAPDGLCEALWMPGQRFVWGVQWHPEHSFPVDENSRKLFAALVEAART